MTVLQKHWKYLLWTGSISSVIMVGYQVHGYVNWFCVGGSTCSPSICCQILLTCGNGMLKVILKSTDRVGVGVSVTETLAGVAALQSVG